jgi:hypothetical protein
MKIRANPDEDIAVNLKLYEFAGLGPTCENWLFRDRETDKLVVSPLSPIQRLTGFGSPRPAILIRKQSGLVLVFIKSQIFKFEEISFPRTPPTEACLVNLMVASKGHFYTEGPSQFVVDTYALDTMDQLGDLIYQLQVEDGVAGLQLVLPMGHDTRASAAQSGNSDSPTKVATKSAVPVAAG